MQQYNGSGQAAEERAEALRVALGRRQWEKEALERRIQLLHEQIYVLLERLPVAERARLEQDPALGELWRVWKIGHRRARRESKAREGVPD
jgi:hypothetical protein